MEYVRSNKLADLTGMSVAAINCMRYQGKWLEGIHWHRQSARCIWYCVPAIVRSIKGLPQ